MKIRPNSVSIGYKDFCNKLLVEFFKRTNRIFTDLNF